MVGLVMVLRRDEKKFMEVEMKFLRLDVGDLNRLRIVLAESAYFS
jgi:hypothetical protein